MYIHDATEIAYKNGYEKGTIEIAKEIFKEIDRLKLQRSLDNRRVIVIDEKDLIDLEKRFIPDTKFC